MNMKQEQTQIQQTQQLKGGNAMIRGQQGFTVETKRQLPRNAKQMKLILHMIRKETWDCWNELAAYSYGSDKEVLLVSDRNYLRVPDPEEKYYYCFYTYTEDRPEEHQYYYVKINKGATSVKGFLPLEEAKEYIKRWIEGEIYKIIRITEEGERLLSNFLALKRIEINGVQFICEKEVFETMREIRDEDTDTHVIIFENATIDKVNNDDTIYYIKPSDALCVVIVKSKTFVYLKNKENFRYLVGYNPEISSSGYFVKIYKMDRRDFLNTELICVKNKTEFTLIPLVR
jgi:hypothetical protein